MSMEIDERSVSLVQLDDDDYTLACHHLMNKYIQTELGCVRSQFIMDLHRDLTTGQSFITIDRPIHLEEGESTVDIDFGALNVREQETSIQVDDFEDDAMSDAVRLSKKLLGSNGTDMRRQCAAARVAQKDH